MCLRALVERGRGRSGRAGKIKACGCWIDTTSTVDCNVYDLTRGSIPFRISTLSYTLNRRSEILYFELLVIEL